MSLAVYTLPGVDLARQARELVQLLSMTFPAEGITDCSECGTCSFEKSLHLCSACRMHSFCDAACLRAAWRKTHKIVCKCVALSKLVSLDLMTAGQVPPSAHSLIDGAREFPTRTRKLLESISASFTRAQHAQLALAHSQITRSFSQPHSCSVDQAETLRRTSTAGQGGRIRGGRCQGPAN